MRISDWSSDVCSSDLVPAEEYVVDPVVEKAMDRIFILHADHEQNASTSTVRLASSSGANPFACIAAGIACLWGPAHGGANEAALNMLREIGTPDRIPERSEEHTSELQSLMRNSYAVFCLKKTKHYNYILSS